MIPLLWLAYVGALSLSALTQIVRETQPENIYVHSNVRIFGDMYAVTAHEPTNFQTAVRDMQDAIQSEATSDPTFASGRREDC